MAFTFASSFFSVCAQPGPVRGGGAAVRGALSDRLDRDRRHSDTVVELRRRRLLPTVQPVEMNKLYNRRKTAGDARKEYEIVDLTSFSDLTSSSVASPSTASTTTAGGSPPARRTLERMYAL